MNKTKIERENKNRLIPLTKWNSFHVWPSIGGLRYLVFNSKKTGFDECLVKVGKRLLIDENKFFDWIDGYRKRRKNE